MAEQDFRARLSPKRIGTNAKTGERSKSDILGEDTPSNILYPLIQTRGVIFPFTPTVTTGNVAEYDASSFIHSNYGFNAYIRSFAKPISIAAEFTAQTNDEAMYLLAVIHFFRSATKSYFGIKPYAKAGTPPPVLLFNYLGEFQYNNVPVVIKSFDYTYPADVDYVPVYTGGNNTNYRYSPSVGVSMPNASSSGYSYVPAHMSVTLELDTQYTPIDLRNNFNLDDFRSGKLYNRGYI